MSDTSLQIPLLAVTMGDAAGVGPETIVRAAVSPHASVEYQMVAVGHPEIFRRAVELVGQPLEIFEVTEPEDVRKKSPQSLPTLWCWNPCRDDVLDVAPATEDARTGQAAYDALIAAIRTAQNGDVDAITTAPLSKAALHLAGHEFPGHTEILAHECGIDQFAMMLYLPRGETVRAEHGLGVAHATLHTSIKSVPELLTRTRVRETIELVDQFMRRVGCPEPRVGVCALNPHAGEGGLFGTEESTIIAPAIQDSQASAIGPLPADTLLKRAVEGEFDGVAAMYHDQGHIALKLIAFNQAVNVTLGLPIIRTSPSQGTAFDIAWKGQASAEGMLAALDVAAQLARTQPETLKENGD